MRISDWRSDVCSSDLQISDYLLTGAVTNALNMPSVLAEDAPKLKPYMKLAEQLGSFVGQLAEANLTKVVIEYEGHVATLHTRPLTAIVLEGQLRRQLDSAIARGSGRDSV